RLKRIQGSLNPEDKIHLVEDKSTFYFSCLEWGIAIPRLYGVVHPDRPGWAFTNELPASQEEWEEFIRQDAPGGFVTKPLWGVYGRGVSVFRRAGNAFVDHLGELWNADQLVQHLRTDRGYLVQERLRNHASLEQLSGTHALQTVRVITSMGRGGLQIIHAHIKIIVGDNIIDNNERGKTGNLEAVVAVNDGTLGPGRRYARNGSGMMTFEVHPDSGAVIEGVRVPLWNGVRELVSSAASRFMPLRTVGWDVAVTDDGPRLIEGNAWYDPPPVVQGVGIDAIVKALRCDLEDWR
ncbi:MAG: sugar-transfer associated ATP-grasp domain-containing protein, partial [Bacteroidota bacterium]